LRPVSVHTHISASREEVFDYVADLAGRPAYCDHYMGDFHLTRPNSSGKGAAARFRLDAPFSAQWAEIAVAEHDRPRRVAEAGAIGRLGRTRFGAVYDFTSENPLLTRVDLTTWSEPGTRGDALRESLGIRRWLRRQSQVALERLRLIFEETPDAPLARVTVAGFEPAKAPRFGASVSRGDLDRAATRDG